MAASRRARAQPRVVGPRGWFVFGATGRKHGTRSMYATGCRCTPCRTANGKYRRARPKVLPTPDPDLADIIRAGDEAAAELIADAEKAYAALSDEDKKFVDAAVAAFDVTDIPAAFRRLS